MRESESIDPSSPHFSHSESVVIALLFAPSVVLSLGMNTIRACLAKMGPFRWATVSAVKIAFPPFETGGNGRFVWWNGTEPLHPNRPLDYYYSTSPNYTSTLGTEPFMDIPPTFRALATAIPLRPVLSYYTLTNNTSNDGYIHHHSRFPTSSSKKQ